MGNSVANTDVHDRTGGVGGPSDNGVNGQNRFAFFPNGLLRGRGRTKYIDFSTLNIHTVIEYLMLPPSSSDD